MYSCNWELAVLCIKFFQFLNPTVFYVFNFENHDSFYFRGVLSMSGLSHGVVRVDQENSLTSLTLQDCGQVLPGGSCLIFVLITLESPCTYTVNVRNSNVRISALFVLVKLSNCSDFGRSVDRMDPNRTFRFHTFSLGLAVLYIIFFLYIKRSSLVQKSQTE